MVRDMRRYFIETIDVGNGSRLFEATKTDFWLCNPFERAGWIDDEDPEDVLWLRDNGLLLTTAPAETPDTRPAST